MRLFIAVELSKEIKKELTALEEKLKSSAADVKWVKPDNVHLTLKFLGETKEEQIEPIKKILNGLAEKFKVFKTEIAGLGSFPNLKSPRVIWIGANNTDTLSVIANLLEEKLDKVGFPKEKRDFQPHLTLGRVRSLKNINILKDTLAKNLDFKAGILEVKALSLIESKLTPSGPIYTAFQSTGLS
ncbi:MAG: RNA 2',3'-cyclic phosphodiesterase [Candidatus Omnitrophota bacterium]